MTQLVRDRYEPLEVVGQGGEGRVLKAVDRLHDRLVALKVRTVHAQTERDQLLREARVLLAITPHPNLTLVREDFFDGDNYVIAMDWIEGTDLATLLRAQGKPGLAPSSVLRWLSEAASALTHLHTQGVVHGDVKPANFVLTTGGRLVLVDFGWSSAPDSPRRRGGTPGFAAPELAAGEPPSRASDVYSLAATAFALLTGEPPTGIRPAWEGIDPSAAAQLEATIRCGLATDPRRRPPTAGEFVEQLRAGWGSTLPTGVLTFCMTDIVGSTPLWDTDPAGMARAIVHHTELVSDVMERHGGRCIHSMGEGDSTVAVFTAALAAVDAAVELQQRLAATPDTASDEPAVQVRAALHTGEAERRDGDYIGGTLNLAARVRGLADAGQVFLSSATAAAVRSALPEGVALVDLGPHRLRGVREVQQVFALSAPGVSAPPPGTSCPYPGLLAFQPDDACLFFGREDVVADLVARLRTHPFVAVVGASGSGKSSLLRAGLVAQWGGGTVVTPGASAIEVPDGDGLLVVDQLEEVFTLWTDDQRRSEFFDALVARSGPVALGLRADFYGRFAEHQSFARELAARHVLLGPMGDDELREAIVGPAGVTGLKVEPALVDILVDEVSGEPGALPLLSHALRVTWEQRDGRTLTVDAYRATGGVRAAIANTAEQVYGALAPTDQELARRTLLALTEPGDGATDTRRRATLPELTPAGDTGQLGAVLDAMASARLVTISEGSVEVAHEALLRNWPRLREWLDEDRDGRRLQRHLIDAATDWQALGRDPAELYGGPRLAAAVEWASRAEQVPALAAEFLDASVAEQERDQRAQARTNRRLRALLAGVGIALVVALVAGGVAIAQRRNASKSRDRADIARVAAVSRSVVERQPDLGMLLAVAAYDLADTAQTRDALLNAVATHPLLEGLIYGVESGLEAAVFSPDGTLLATPTSDGTGTILWDTVTHERVGVLRDGLNLNVDAAFSADGRLLAVPAVYVDEQGLPRGRLHVWDVQSRTVVARLDSPAGGLTTAAFSADGSRLYAQGGIRVDAPMRDEVAVWDTASWTPEPTWVIADEYPGDSTFVVSRDGSAAAQTLTDGTVVTFRTADRSPLGPPIDIATFTTDSTGPVNAVAIAPAAQLLAIATDAGGVFIVDPANATLRHHLDVAESAVTAIEFSPDGAVLAAGRIDGRTQLYDVATGGPAGPPLAASATSITDVSFNADGSRLVTTSTDRTGAFWRLDGGRAIGVVLDLDSPVTETAFTSDGTRIVTGALDGTVAVHDVGTGDLVTTLAAPGEVLSVAIDPGGQRLAAGTTAGVMVGGLDGSDVHAIDVGEGWATQVVFSGDGTTLVVGLDRTSGADDVNGPGSGAVVYLDPTSGARRSTSELDESVIALALSPDGRTTAAVTGNNVVHFLAPDEVGPAIENPDALITSVAYRPDGTRLAIGIITGAVRQYDAVTHEPVGELLDGDPNGIFGVAYSPDGTLLAGTSLGFSTTRLWDARTGATVGTRLTGGRVPYSYRTFTVEHLMGSRPAFAPSGDVLAAPGFPGATVLWDLVPEHWRAAACAIAGRELTPEEWTRYLPGRERRALCGT